jgi:hypothetical protein
VFLVNSRLSRFTAAPSTPPLARKNLLGHPFFRRYGVNLPSSLTEVRSFTLGEIPLPTSVGLRYGQTRIWLAAFLDGLGADDFRPLTETRPSGHRYEIGTSLDLPLPTGNPPCPFGGLTFPTASPLHSLTMQSGAGLSNLLAIAYDYNVLGLGPD